MCDMNDWIDDEYFARSQGRTRALTQAQHEAVNGRSPGATLEYCERCGEATGPAGAGEDSIFDDDGGPYCDECAEELGIGGED